MDSFTENILNRARERQKLLDKYSNDIAMLIQETTKNIALKSYNLDELKNNNIPNNNVGQELQNKPAEKSIDTNLSPSCMVDSSEAPKSEQNYNKPSGVTLAESTINEKKLEDYSSDSTVPNEEAKRRLDRLGHLYAGGDNAEINSPVHKNEETNHQQGEKKRHTVLNKLADLANKIKEWELDNPMPEENISNINTEKNERIELVEQFPGTKLKTSLRQADPNIEPDNNKQLKVTFADDITNERKSILNNEEKRKLEELERLYAGGDNEVHRNEGKSVQQNEREKVDSKKRKTVLHKLANLAQNIKEWEDDLSRSKVQPPEKFTKKTWKPPVTRTTSYNNYSRQPIQKPNSSVSTAWNSKEMGNEKGGHKTINIGEVNDRPRSTSYNNYSRQPSQKPSSLVSKEMDEKGVHKTINIDEVNVRPRTTSYNNYSRQPIQKPSSSVSTARNSKEMGNEKGGHKTINIGEVNVRFANIHSNFEKKGTTTPVKPTSTKPTEIKNKNPVIVSTDKTVKDPVFMSVLERKALFEKKSEATIRNKQDKIKSSHIKENTCTNPSFLQNTEPKSETVAGKLVNILKAQSTISETEIVSSIKEQRQKEMEMLLNRFNKNKGNKDDKPIPKEVVSKEELPLQEIIKEKDHQRSIEKPLSIPSDSHPLTRDINFNEDLKHIKDNQLDYPIDSTTQVKNNMDKNPLPNEDKSKQTHLPIKEDNDISMEKRGSTHSIVPNEDKSKQTHLPIKEDNDISMEKRGSTHSIVPEMNCDKNLKQIQENQFDFPISSPALPLNSSESNGVEIVYQITSHKRPHSNNFTVSIVSNILNEVLDKMEENPNGATPSKQGRVSEDNDVVTPTRLCDSEESTPKSVISPITLPFNSLSGKLKRKQSMDNAEGEKRILLKHTVSLYRKQQAQMTKPLVKQTRQPWRHQVSIDNGDESADLVKKAQELNEEVNRQQTIIAQTSQALDLCTSTPEFVGSLEQVEAEKVLLVATHRHQAALQEAQRIQVDGTTKSNNGLSQSLPLEKGTLTISNIRLPLKQQYLKALAAVGGNGFHFICLVKCAEQVVPTKLTTTTENYLCIPDIITLSNIYSDFIVRFEVYGLETKKESTQDAKHHVNRKSTNKLATQSNTDTALSTVKASSFMLLGYVMFSVQTSNKTHWVLNNCPLLSPLEGYVDMNINCELEISVKHKGFLTMFEDIGGFGAWHRRWCSLKGFTLSYWKYPDDEGVMAPIACICLKQCVTENVAPVSTDICTRLHTFLLEIERDAYPEDKVTLVMQRKGDKTIIKHLLSADTKEERIKWCQKFNSALTATRMWGIRD